MFDTALIQQCADPGIEIAIVERFIADAGSNDPLAVSITSGNRIILPEAPRSPDEALRLIQRFAGQASVRVGITQYPAGYGVSNAADIPVELLDPCTNIAMGTALFAKVYRIVAAGEEATSSSYFTEAVAAWKSGRLGADYVFGMPDPALVDRQEKGDGRDVHEEHAVRSADGRGVPDDLSVDPGSSADPNKAHIRIDLSAIDQGNPLQEWPDR